MTEATRREIIELFDAGIDAQSPLDQKQRVAELIRNDDEAQAFFIEMCQMHAMLAWEHGAIDAMSFEEFPAETQRDPRDLLLIIRRWRLVALAASLLLVVTVCWMTLAAMNDRQTQREFALQKGSSPSTKSSNVAWQDRDVVGTVSHLRGASLGAEGLKPPLGETDQLRTGYYRLKSGFAELNLQSGVRMVVESPAEFEIDSPMLVVVHQGKLSARVAPEGRGFAVETPSARLVDHGTEFCIDVSQEVGSEVHVFDGEVTVRPKFARAESDDLRLTANQATRIRGESGIPEGIDIDHARFVRQLSEPIGEQAGYAKLLASLQPRMWFRMPPAVDGITLADRGSNRNDATLFAGKKDHSSFKAGRVGSSLHLGGPSSGSYAHVSNYRPFEGGAMTLCVWVRADSRPRWAAIAKHWSLEFTEDRTSYSGAGGQFHFGLHEDSGDLELQVRDTEGRIVKLRENVPLPIGRWHHVAFVVDGSKVRMYRNGMLVDAAVCNGLAIDGPSTMGIGAKLNAEGTAPNLTNPGYWHGRIDELALFDTALSETQIKLLANVLGPLLGS